MSEKPKYSIRLSKAAKEFNVSETTIKEFLARKGFQIYQLPKMKLTTDMYALLVREYCFSIRLSKAAKEFNVGVSTIREFLAKKGFQVDSSPNAKLTAEMYALLVKEFQGEKVMKKTAKKLENFIDWGHDSSVDLPNKNDRGMVSVTEPTNEENKNEEEIVVSLNKLHFGNNIISLKHKKIDFVSWEMGISMYLNSEKSINNLSTKILLNYSNLSFSFLDLSLLSSLKDLSTKLEEEKKQEIIQKQRAKEAKEKNRLKKQKEKEEIEKKAKEKRQLRKENGGPQKAEEKTVEKVIQKSESQIQSSAIKTMMLVAGNIRFYNGYYLIFQTINGEIDNSVTPYRIDDPNSHEILNLVHKYFEQILEQKRIIVKYDETKILEPSRLDLFQLGNYVRDLKRNLDEKGVWWEEVQNARKRSFGQCFGEPTESVKKRVARSKNEFLYNLSSLQNEKKLIRVYEINHGKEEDAFIFTISMSNNRCAIVFENASKVASTTTWIFVAKEEDYETCINLVFDYFTDYTISLKRSSLRSTINPPEKFKAESYAFIYHDDIGQWLKKLNKIIGQTPEPSEIQFVPGLHIPESSDTRSGHGETISTRHLHNQLMSKLYDKLCSESGKDNVGTEIRVGTKRIDTVVNGNDFYDIYEIKTAENPFECVTEALGQLCQYTYLFCRDKIGKMVIVGPSEMTKEVKDYLSWFRKNYSLQLYYMKV